MRLFTRAVLDVYALLSFDFTLDFMVNNSKVLKNKSIYVQKYLHNKVVQAFLIKNRGISDSSYSEISRNITVVEVGMFLLDQMEEFGYLEKVHETYTRSDFEARQFLLTEMTSDQKMRFFAIFDAYPDSPVNIVLIRKKPRGKKPPKIKLTFNKPNFIFG